MLTQNKVPEALLAGSKDERLRYFKAQLVGHTRLMQTLKEIKRRVRCAQPGRLLLFYGPPGVGKTTVRQLLVKELINESLAGMQADPGWTPAVAVEAIAPERRAFDWVDFYMRALFALHEPLVEHKIAYPEGMDYGVSEVKVDDQGRLLIQNGTRLNRLRLALENCLAHRHPLVFIVDEAPHLQSVGSGRCLREQMDTIKSLAETTRTVWLLIGTYDLLNLTNLSGQLSRRSRHLEFPRYRLGDPEDELAFKQVLVSFQQHLPFPEPGDLVGAWSYIYEKTFGCVGVVKDWLVDAIGDALDDEKPTLKMAYLQQNEPSADRLLNVFREIQEGERHAAEMMAQEAHLKQLLEADQARQQSHARQAASAPSRRAAKTRVGQRKPARDVVGRGPHD
jgi:DNA polymerase III delta prime subunit